MPLQFLEFHVLFGGSEVLGGKALQLLCSITATSEDFKEVRGLLSSEKPSVPWAGGVVGRPFTVQLFLGKLLVSKGREIDLPEVSQQLFIKHTEQINGVRESLFIWKNHEWIQMDLSDII